MATTAPAFTLHTFWRSTSSARLRVALNLKSIPYHPVYVNLFANEQNSPSYVALNPSRTVPLLVHHVTGSGNLTGTSSATTDVSIGQSIAALEYLEEVYPEQRPLLPPRNDLAGRAFVRAFVSVVVADIQPVTSLRVLSAIGSLPIPSGQDAGERKLAWALDWTVRGLKVLEGMLESRPKEWDGKYCYGDQLTHADVCLVTAMWNAVINRVDLTQFPKIRSIYELLSELEEVKRATPNAQEDAPKSSM
jgi:maleylacetoacetate isomerase